MNNNPNIYKPLLQNISKLNNLNLRTSISLTQNELKPYIGTKMIPLFWDNIYEEYNDLGFYALICVDLHKVANQWVHLYIPKIAFNKNSFNNKNLLNLNVEETIIGKNTFGNRGYNGPQPPKGSGNHKYVFYLFALKKDANSKISINEREECKNVAQFIEMVGSTNIIGYTDLSFFYENK